MLFHERRKPLIEFEGKWIWSTDEEVIERRTGVNGSGGHGLEACG